ncbi:polyamine ABC transporter substrate-binding protein [Trichothermofontia sp.]
MHHPPPVRSLSRRRFLRRATLFSGLTLASCGWTLGNVGNQSSQRTSTDDLLIYTWSDYIDQESVEAFTAQTGITVQVAIYESNETMLARMLAGGGNNYSIIYPSDYMVQQMLELNLLRELDHDRLEGLENLMEEFQDPSYDPGNRHSVPVSWGTTGLIYNTDKLAEPVEDWRYLWDHQSALQQRITMLSDVREVMGATLKSLGYSYNATDPQQINAAFEALQTLKPAIASFTTDAWREQILAGDLLISMAYSVDGITAMREDDTLQYVIPKSGASLWTDAIVIPRTAPNVEGAYAWINYILQPSAAARISERLNFATPNRLAYENLSDELRENTALFPPPEVLERCERIVPLDPATNELFDNYWTRLTSG